MNPLDYRQFEHYLNFKNDDTGLIKISEPVKFDAAEFVIEQDVYARDISYMSEEISLEFYKGQFEQSEEPYIYDSGIVVYNLTHAFDKIIRYNQTYGFQSHIEYILKRNGNEFILGELNFEGMETDEVTYFRCKVIQSTKRALARRREDTTVDVFSNEDLDGNYISPIQTEKMLLKAKPNVQLSTWKSTNKLLYSNESPTLGDSGYYQNTFVNTIKSGIRSTLNGSIFQTLEFYNNNFDEKFYNFGYVDALDNLSNIKMTLKDVTFDYYIEVGADISENWFGQPNIQPRILVTGRLYETGDTNNTTSQGSFGQSFYLPETAPNPNVTMFSYEFLGTQPVPDNSIFVGNADLYRITIPDIEIDIPDIPIGYRICWSFFMGRDDTLVQWKSDSEVSIRATATSIDTVINVVRYIDLAKQSLKAINGMDLIAPEHEEGGKYYNLFAASGNLIRQRTDVPFYVKYKDRRENLMLMNSDIQINDYEAFCLRYDKFYSNVDNGAFELDPSEESVSTYNEKYALNLIEWSFKNYEKDDDEENTIDGVHTYAQFAINNDKVKNTKKIEIEDILDPFKIEYQRKQLFKETTALDSDNDIFVIDGVPIAPGTEKSFSANMKHLYEDGVLKILKGDDLPSWELLGFEVGSFFYIDSDENNGTYIVDEIETSILTLIPQGFTPTDDGEIYTTVRYPLENVSYQNRTDEGFGPISGVLSPDNFSNLRYTIRRCLIDWESYISTAAEFIDSDIKNTEFINNGELTTQFEGGEIYKENADIVLDDIEPAILSTRVYDVTVKAEYDQVLDIISKYQNLDTVGGFIRVKWIDGSVKRLHPQKLGYTWATKKLNIIGESRKDDNIIYVRKLPTGYEINGNVYPVIDYETSGDFLCLYDDKFIKIINFTKYNKFVVQGETLDNIEELTQAIINL